jgi:hypothetical protein
MILKYDVEVSKEVILKRIDKITNLIFKLLPLREEGGDWKNPLNNIIIELVGMDKILSENADFFPLLCKMEALLTLDKEKDFMLFRKNIFECLELINEIKRCLD